MPRKCIIKTCTNSETKRRQGLLQDITFHKFPLNTARRNKWIVKIQVSANQSGRIPKAAIICSEHFDESSYIIKPNGPKVLSDTALPSLFQTVNQSFSEIEMIASDCDSNNEDDTKNVQRRCVNVQAILSEPEHQSNFQTNESVGTDGDTLQQSRDVLIQSEDAKKVQIRCVDVQAILSDPPHQERKRNFQNNESVGISADNLQQRRDDAILLETVRKPMARSWHTPVCEDNNTDPLSQNESIHRIKLPKRIRYPGDVVDVQSMSRIELEKCVAVCKTKVESQSKMIAALHRKVREKDRQIARLRCLVKRK